MKRTIAAVVSVPFAFVVIAAPAQAAPKDAQGCENKKASQLDPYCDATETP